MTPKTKVHPILFVVIVISVVSGKSEPETKDSVDVVLDDGYDPCANPHGVELATGTFPDDFVWGVATAAYQIEGGWNAGGKGESIWDEFTHRNPSPIDDKSSGDVACDSYHKWHTDIQMLKEMNLSNYRLSFAWARLIPSGIVSEKVNPDGVRYYRDLLTNLTAAGIQPMVTLYHWDLPQALQMKGGWQNEQSSDWFKDYAELCFELFGDLVKSWITFNEPWVVSALGYGSGVFAPGINNCVGTCPYIATHNIIKAHAKAYRSYDKNYRPMQKGQVGITLNTDYRIPNTTSEADRNASERAMQFAVGWFAHPIFKNGDYPAVMKEVMARRSKAEGLIKSRLPEFEPWEQEYIKGTADFFGMNTYTSSVYANPDTPSTEANYFVDAETISSACENWGHSGSDWLRITPWAPQGLLEWVKKEYDNPMVYITENGVSDRNGSTADTWRIEYYRTYINSVLRARQGGSNVVGYMAWSLMDNFEWARGYTEKFGLYYVNYTDPDRPRTAKDSAKFFAKLVAENGFPPKLTTAVPTTTTSKASIVTVELTAIVLAVSHIFYSTVW